MRLHRHRQFSTHGELRSSWIEGYWDRARKECKAYIALLRRSLGQEPPGAFLTVKVNAHDSGSYLSVICYFDSDNPQASDYALRCESQGPELWDTQARNEHAGERR